MNSKKLIILFLIGFLLSITAGCGPTIPGPSIISIMHDPETPAEGGDVIFLISYKNKNETEIFTESLLEVTYDPDLIYKESFPYPDRVDTNQHSLNWSLGSLQPGDVGEVKITFLVNKGFPLEKYKLDINASISSKSSQGTPIAKYGSGSTYVEGHDTPTPVPKNTETSERAKTMSVNNPLIQPFETEGVTVELPWQGQELEIRKGDFDTELLQNPIQEGFEIIRPVIFFDVIDSEAQVIHSFDPAMIVTVSYTAQDLGKNGDPSNLVLLIFDSAQGIWIANDTRIDPSAMTGSVSISSWTSHICWGR